MIVDMQMEQERRAFEKANGIKSPSLITVTQYKAGIRENLTAKERVYEDLYDLKYPMATSGWPRIKLAFCRALNFITRRQQDHPKAFGITEHTTQYKTRKRLRRRNIVRWWFEYVTYAPALLFLYIGVCGLVACYLQLRFCHSAMDNLDAILKPGEFNSTGTPDLVNVTASAPASGSAPKPRIMTREVPLTGVAALWEKIKPEISIPKTLYSHITATGSALIRDNAGSSHQDLLNSLGHLNTVRTEYKVARSLSTNSTNSAQQQQQQQQESESGAVKYIVEWHAKVARDITARPASEPLSATEEATLSVPLAIIASLPGAVVDAGSIDTAQRAGRIERTIGRWFGVVPRSSSSSSSSPDSRISTRGHLKKSQDSSDIYGSRNHPLDIIAEYIRERNIKPVVNRSAKSASTKTKTTRRQFGADKDEETAAATEATVPGTITDRSIMDTVGNAVNNVVNGIGDTVKGIGSAISGMFNAVKNYAAKLLQYVGKLLLWPFAKVAQWLLSKYELLVWAEVKLFVGVLGVWIAIAVQGLIGVIFKLIYEWLTKHKVD
ncbi:hypothetical protein GQ42DRAFT_153857 [Ramicandelaber brevisporus]|nr:hypothetical protein GQ42DRAFT_153857 [Ramicandelaber brevisporus]